MSEDIGIGYPVEFARPRDAVHIAVIPVQAADPLEPGWKVEIDEAGWAFKATALGKAVGVVDPYLDHAAEKGQRLWLFLYPGSIKGVRHEWSHPTFPLAVETGGLTPTKAREWLEAHAADFSTSYDSLVAGAADGSVCYGTDDGREWANIPGHVELFWVMMEAATGARFTSQHKDGTYFSCSC
jgi:hypothetical protein